MNYRILIITCALIYSAICSLSVYAGEGYLGASFGSSKADSEGFKDDSGFKITGGFQVSESLALEGSYLDLGSFSADADLLEDISNFVDAEVLSSSIDISGIELSALASIPVGERISLFARLGIFFWDADISVSVNGFGGGTESDDGSDLGFGVGAKIEVMEQLSLKAEFSRYDALDDVDFLSAGLDLRF